MLDPMDLYRMQAEGQAFSAPQLQGSPQDNQNYISQSPIMQMASASAPASPAYAPSSGAQKEDASRNSVDSIIAHMAQQRAADRQNDRNLQWMTFFSKLASSKNPTLLGGLGEGADALSEVTGKQAQSNKILDQSALEDQLKVAEWNREQERQEAAQKSTEAYQQGELGVKRQELALGKYQPVKDVFGNVTGIFDAKSGKMMPMPNATMAAMGDTSSINAEPSPDPQEAASQILNEQGSPMVPVASRQDITGRNQQVKAYNDQALAAKNVIQQLDALDAQTGKYTPGKVAGAGYGLESSMGMGGESATARTEADKAATQLTNAFMQANTASNRSGIGVLNFDARGVPNADMTDEARADLIAKNRAVANSQIQRNIISNLYPRMHLSNVNTLMDNYESKNPPLLPSGSPNPNWMTYKDWLKAGRPTTADMALKPSGSSTPDYSHLWGGQ